MLSKVYEPIMPESPESTSCTMSALCAVVLFSFLSPVTGCDGRERDRTKNNCPPPKESKESGQAKKTQQHKQTQPQGDSDSKIKQNRATPVRIPNPSESFRPLKQSLAKKLVQLSLDCVGREYPNKPGDVQSSDKDVLPPRKLHPAFYGCFDWHSSVHGHYTMVRVLKEFPSIEVAGQIRKTLDHHLEANRIRAEAAYFEDKHRKLFERPYGWAWLLRLAAEIRTMKARTAKAESIKETAKQNQLNAQSVKKWAEALEPLEKVIVKLTIEYLSKLSLPVRAGTHHSTAFALAHIHDYARITGHKELEQSVKKAALKFFMLDRDCPTAYEPSGEDFISPCLAEADLMRRVLSAQNFRRWLADFLPPFSDSRFESLLHPPKISDRKDPKIGHLIGLMFHRAWTFKGIAESLGKQDARTSVLNKLSLLHENEGLRLMFDSGYGGTHWLASFAVFSFTDANIRDPELLPTTRTSGDPEPTNSAN